MSWPAVPAELLSGPRGRHACFEVVSPYNGEVELEQFPAWLALRYGSGDADPAQLADELAAIVAAADLDAVAAAGDAGLLRYVSEAVTWAIYWQAGQAWQRMLATDEIGAVLEPVARAITTAPAARWWSWPVDPDRQQYAQFLSRDGDLDMEPPAITGAADHLARWRAEVAERERAAARWPSDPAANYTDWWWSTPELSKLVSTSRSVPGLGALRLCLVEDSLGWPEALCWPLKPRPSARVYEIRGPQDWTTLVRQYPLDVTKSRWHDWFKITGRAGTWLIPDYGALAADYDGVHLTVGGYLTTAGRPLAVDDSLEAGAAATMLAGWDPDLTYWLADVLEPAGSAGLAGSGSAGLAGSGSAGLAGSGSAGLAGSGSARLAGSGSARLAGSGSAGPGGQPVRWVERDGEPLGWAAAE
jgi:hypothetical protein